MPWQNGRKSYCSLCETKGKGERNETPDLWSVWDRDRKNMMTQEAMQVLEASDVIIGYTVYLKLLGGTVRGQKNYCLHRCGRSGNAARCVSRRQEKAKKWH